MEINLYVLISFVCIIIALVAVTIEVTRARRDSRRLSQMREVLEFSYFQLNDLFRGLQENEQRIRSIHNPDRFYDFFDRFELAIASGIGRIRSVIGINPTKRSHYSRISRANKAQNSLTPESLEYIREFHDNTSKKFPRLIFLLLVDKVLGIMHGDRQKDVRRLTPSSDLREDLDMDSLDLVELVMEFEELLSIELSDAELMGEAGNVFSLGDLVLLGERKYEEFKQNECRQIAD